MRKVTDTADEETFRARVRGKPAGKPGSVADSHSSWRTVTRALQRPTRGQREPRCRPLRGLAPDGVCRAARVATGAVRSYRTISPLPAPGGASAVYFLWHFPSPRGARPLAGILLFGARTFLCLRLLLTATQRLSGRLPAAKVSTPHARSVRAVRTFDSD